MNVQPSAKHEFVAEATEARLRLDRFLAARLPDISRNRLQALIREGHVCRAGATIVDPNERVNEGDLVALSLPPAVTAEPEGETIPLDIVHEDGDLIVINKPPGLVVHPAAGNRSGTLVNALIAHCGDSLSGIGGVKRPGIVHRLDKDTSGLLVAAKNDAAHRGLAKQFAAHGRDGALERVYQAIVWGVPDRPKGEISASLDRARTDRRKRAVVQTGGKEAVTRYAVAQRFGDVAALVECRLMTGRTHQIRVHMAHIGHPLLGDQLYGKGFATRASRLTQDARAALDRLGRQALHAGVLGFRHPASGDIVRFERPPPRDMHNLVTALSKI